MRISNYTRMKTASVLYYVFLFMGTTFASFASATDLKLDSSDKEEFNHSANGSFV